MDKILVTRSSMPDINEYFEEIRTMWDTHWLTNMGPKHEQFQQELRKYLEVDGIDLFTNGHMALELSLQALELQGEVITTPFTFASTTHAIVRNGLSPVFCDIREDDFTIDADKIEALITDKTCAILPVHVYGNICDVEKIEQIAQKYKLKVVYDAAHAFGVRYKGRSVADFGDVSCFSFHATKVFNSIEGGAACFHDETLGRELYRLKNFGIRDEDTVDGIGANAKMNEFCAAMGLCNLRHYKTEQEKRKDVVKRYQQNLIGIAGLRTNDISEYISPNYSYFPIIIDKERFGADRNAVYATLAENGIGARKYFYPLTNTFQCFDGKYDFRLTPIAFGISNSVLTLPLYADLDLKTVDKICEIILKCKKG